MTSSAIATDGLHAGARQYSHRTKKSGTWAMFACKRRAVEGLEGLEGLRETGWRGAVHVACGMSTVSACKA